MKKNMFCALSSLKNEADVEQNLLRRLVEQLGYKDSDIQLKESIKKLAVGAGRASKGDLYKPDFCITKNRYPRWLIEAKSPEEKNLDNHAAQVEQYCFLLNRKWKDKDPVEFFLLSNGSETRLYKANFSEPVLTLKFEEMEENNPKYKQLIDYLNVDNWKRDDKSNDKSDLSFKKATIEEANSAFSWCHQLIYKKGNLSQAAAFTEFCKLIFLKLMSDKKVAGEYPELINNRSFSIPADYVIFSEKYIERELNLGNDNPINSRFIQFVTNFEKDIAKNEKQRIFEKNDTIKLQPTVILKIVEKLQGIYLHGIDADLKGRLFETFLNATMRGKDLGQFFTPRSMVKLVVKLADISVVSNIQGEKTPEVVVDYCSGSGGYLIEALSDMQRKIDSLPIGSDEKVEKKNKLASEHIYGCDIGVEPNLARIARMNLYLHGDSGSKIFQVDALDKELRILESDNEEVVAEKSYLHNLHSKGPYVDVVLTNPPFAKEYDSSTEHEKAILGDYSIAVGKTNLKSSLMFFERYHDILVDGGRLLSVVDDGILSGKKYKWFRDYLREKFNIKAIISMPGDAFQRSKARVKTSLIILEKSDSGKAGQADVFMYPCKYIGIDDPNRERTLPEDYVVKEKAQEEIEEVYNLYSDFLKGKCPKDYIVNPSRITERLDVKSCMMIPGFSTDEWNKKGFNTQKLDDLLTLRQFDELDTVNTSSDFETILDQNNWISSIDGRPSVTYLRVTYTGFCESGERIFIDQTQYPRLFRVRTGDIVVSNIAASHGSICIIPPEFDNYVVTNEYTVMKPKEGIDPKVLWMLMRSPEARADMLFLATGISRSRVTWDVIKNVTIPFPNGLDSKELASYIYEAEELEIKALKLREQAKKSLYSKYALSSGYTLGLLEAFKPPK
ncbi:N-6 DNA methylase [Aliivibrio fischeri]|uniref:N-6 DNA methylase n=1 Tax=Aliivibrio fischeri TaxID=668 RepID=UPI0018C65AF3|nr:N-6 DNA methylase [Aliivibrio fischeri]